MISLYSDSETRELTDDMNRISSHGYLGADYYCCILLRNRNIVCQIMCQMEEDMANHMATFHCMEPMPG
jgi:hypothetical protein